MVKRSEMGRGEGVKEELEQGKQFATQDMGKLQVLGRMQLSPNSPCAAGQVGNARGRGLLHQGLHN